MTSGIMAQMVLVRLMFIVQNYGFNKCRQSGSNCLSKIAGGVLVLELPQATVLRNNSWKLPLERNIGRMTRTPISLNIFSIGIYPLAGKLRHKVPKQSPKTNTLNFGTNFGTNSETNEPQYKMNPNYMDYIAD